MGEKMVFDICHSRKKLSIFLKFNHQHPGEKLFKFLAANEIQPMILRLHQRIIILKLDYNERQGLKG